MDKTLLTPAPAVRIAAPPADARLLRATDGPEDADAYRAAGSYGPLPDPAVLLDEADRSGLLGRGGAAFPLGVKLRSVREACRAGVRPVVVANGEEGEPMSIKDRWLLRYRPHLVLDGLRLAAHAVGADTTHVYVSDPVAAEAVREAGGNVVEVAPAYVAGEETAAVQALNGGRALPTDKPPRPYESGVGGRPTLVSNVETLASLAYLARHGADAFRSQGTPASPGTFLATISGGGRAPVLYELPHGMPFAELLERHGVDPDDVHGALLGGYFAGAVNRRVLDLTLDHETARRFDTGLGCGAIALIGTDDCPVAVVASVMAYFDRENAGQCGSCFNGTAAMSAVAAALRDFRAEQADLDRLTRWSVVLRGRGACGTLDGATNVAASLLREFPSEVDQHLHGGCDRCAGDPYRADRPFEVRLP
ncbi:NADH-ubiquinone oxidoreductase-F iron-sulfur binding region domain-containing protein [Cryptosporangium aurantiacum]|uniref:NADH:ubiquinone oxidoreductase, NADH-binding subunit (Chain F) n=1 Tax=Cryptosporangium aurantiacum TaxID=134849 RepID=A0A1M7KHE4_9ACTN|nr:NADH-ubiquinone oxidoreductase-F iron-sulfur binding region domain-containing protein [Cryptosporangium aurantiacum]SHM64532.1 NADH:ubiquinone oxidoreductase, NADH-binding subunit (chain F) [Cryptosporangium aurantiacum]